MTPLADLRQILTDIFGLAISFEESKDGELIVIVKPEGIHGMMKLLRDNQDCRFDFLRCLSGVDYPDYVEIAYHLRSRSTSNNAVVKTKVAKKNPVVMSVTDLWAGADWHERETAELFGVTFEGHPDPRKLLLPDGYDKYPLRKDFKP
ncbi:MAG: NADH-quinone oxidoreductase subunit C [Actinomycetota bacterium]